MRKFLILTAALTLFAGPGWAQTDPTTLHIGDGANTATCSTGGCPIFGTEVNQTGQTDLSIYQTQSSNNPLQNPFLIFLSVPNGTASTFGSPTIIDPFTGVTYYSNYVPGSTTNVPAGAGTTSIITTTVYGLSSSFIGLMGPGQNLYDFACQTSNGGTACPGNSSLPLNGLTNSDSFTNFAAVEADLNTLSNGTQSNITATDFAVFAFEISLAPNAFNGSTNNLVDLSFLNLPTGTLVDAFACEPNCTTSLTNGQLNYATPFTEAGLDTNGPPHPPNQVPEPGSMVMFGTSLIIFGLYAYRRRRNG